MEVVAQEPFGWTLFRESDGVYVLSTLCGRVAQYGIEIRLTPAETYDFERHGLSVIDALASQVSDAPDSYAARAISGFFSKDVKAAISRWKDNPGDVR